MGGREERGERGERERERERGERERRDRERERERQRRERDREREREREREGGRLPQLVTKRGSASIIPFTRTIIYKINRRVLISAVKKLSSAFPITPNS